MKLFFVALLLAVTPPWRLALPVSDTEPEEWTTTTDHNKDLYVIHATVYEVGILTNKTSNDTEDSTDRGEQVAVTFFHKNGSEIDFSKIPQPLYTNVTGQSLTGVAPVDPQSNVDTAYLAAADGTQSSSGKSFIDNIAKRFKRDALYVESGSDSSNDEASQETTEHDEDSETAEFKSNEETPGTPAMREKRDLTTLSDGGEEHTLDVKGPVQVRNGSAVVPPESALQSIAIPPLLTLNGNLSRIPVPIPNTSVISFSTLTTHTAALNQTV